MADYNIFHHIPWGGAYSIYFFTIGISAALFFFSALSWFREEHQALRSKAAFLAVACLGPREPDIAALERMVSMGAAMQNLLLGAHAMGFGAGLTSGQAMGTERMRRLCGLAQGEQAVCCINIGTVTKRKPAARLRPLPSDLVSELPDASGESSV